jgi:hypothetical protein
MKWYEKLYVGLLLAVLAVIVVHAPLTVWAGTTFPQLAVAIKFWKEALLFIAIPLLLYIAYRKNKFGQLLGDSVVQIALAYAGLHLLLLPVMFKGLLPAAAGLMIDLRFVAFFVLVWSCATLYPKTRPLFMKVAVVGAAVVMAFALLQVFVLPRDILAHIGYSKATIEPYLTVDLNDAFVRINSTLRGPNPLGAYAGMVLAVATAAICYRRVPRDTKWRVLVGVLIIGGVVSLYTSYSRSAIIGGIAMVIVAAAIALRDKLSRQVWIGISVGICAIIGGMLALLGPAFVSNVVLHENPSGGSAQKSNEGHIESLQQGSSRILTQPLGAGIGSTGSASLYSGNGLIIENQYLFIAHEAGWVGLGLFIWLLVEIMRRLWHRQQDYLALGVFASGIGLAFIGLLLPVWVDDTVSIVWWGLAAVALGGKELHDRHKAKQKAA